MADDTTSNFWNASDDDIPDSGDAHFNDADLDAMMSDFEKDFEPDSFTQSDQVDHDVDPTVPEGSFEDELEGLLGDKAKVVLMCTRLSSAELLAAFCRLADIAADCIDVPEGAVAILHNLEGENPEHAAQDITSVISGLSVLLVVNRADNISATVYYEGKAGEQLPPPFVFPTLAPFVEDTMLGITQISQIEQEFSGVIHVADIDRDEAMRIIHAHTRND